eukprot:1156785-Pelagomonas_calceolata.AAC.15
MVVSCCCPKTEPALLLLLHAANSPSGSGACWWADSHCCSFCQVLGLAFERVVSAVGLHEVLALQHTHPTILIPYHRVQLALPGMISLLSAWPRAHVASEPPHLLLLPIVIEHHIFLLLIQCSHKSWTRVKIYALGSL